MSKPVTMLQVFIASPGDVQEERDVICQVLQDWNDRHADEYGYVLQPRRWEKHSTPELGGRPQAILNRQIVDSCDILIGIFWTKLGTPTGESESGTVEEIERAANLSKPVMLYFSGVRIEPDRLDGVEFARLKAFRAQMQTRGLYDSYRSVEEFRDKVTRHIHSHVRRIRDGVPITLAPVAPLAETQAPQSPQLAMTYRTVKRHIDETGYCFRHDYELVVVLRNTTTQTLREWHIDVRLPRVLQDSSASPRDVVSPRRASDDAHRILYPDDEEKLLLPYTVDDEVYDRRSEVFQQHIRARAFVAGKLVGECDETVENMQNF